jgi:hypothetical protein
MPEREKELLKKIIATHNQIMNAAEEKAAEQPPTETTEETTPQPKKLPKVQLIEGSSS